MRIRKIHRASIRRPYHDYRSPQTYAITICTAHRRPIFGRIVDGEVRRSTFGDIACDEWVRSGNIRSEITLDEFVVMPDHFHALVAFDGTSMAWDPFTPTAFRRSGGDLGSLVAGFKSAVTTCINTLRRTPGARVWQRGYYESRIRDHRHFDNVRRYIVMNPARAG